MTNLIPRENTVPNAWKSQAYIIGSAVGLLFGLVSAYMYTRAASDYGRSPDGPNRVQTGEVLGLALAALAIIRQVAEMGRGPDPKKGRRK